jgi:cytochrome c-type biogenesis protein CcmH
MIRAVVFALLLGAAPLVPLVMSATAVIAVQPDEIMEDPALEARAREISEGLRGPVCRNESIDASSAPIARELRLLVREFLAEGMSDREVVDAVVLRYGEYVLLRPDAAGANIVLWLAAPAMLIAALGVGWVTVRRRASAVPPAQLSDDEKTRLAEILKT